MGDVTRLKTNESASRPLPKRIIRPCEWGLQNAIAQMEQQMGSIEAYNLMVRYAEMLKKKIDSGKAEKQSEIFAVHPKGDPKT